MAKKGSGVNTKVAKKAYNDVKKHLAQLETYAKELQNDVESLNKNMWYGGTKAANWYESVSTTFAGVVKFDQGVTQFQSSLHSVFAKSSSAGISFM